MASSAGAAEYASTFDRYNSMEIDAIDAAVDAFESYDHVDNADIATLMQKHSGAIVITRFVALLPEVRNAITHAIRSVPTSGFAQNCAKYSRCSTWCSF